jgi:hypothetical protein
MDPERSSCLVVEVAHGLTDRPGRRPDRKSRSAAPPAVGPRDPAPALAMEESSSAVMEGRLPSVLLSSLARARSGGSARGKRCRTPGRRGRAGEGPAVGCWRSPATRPQRRHPRAECASEFRLRRGGARDRTSTRGVTTHRAASRKSSKSHRAPVADNVWRLSKNSFRHAFLTSYPSRGFDPSVRIDRTRSLRRWPSRTSGPVRGRLADAGMISTVILSKSHHRVIRSAADRWPVGELLGWAPKVSSTLPLPHVCAPCCASS